MALSVWVTKTVHAVLKMSPKKKHYWNWHTLKGQYKLNKLHYWRIEFIFAIINPSKCNTPQSSIWPRFHVLDIWFWPIHALTIHSRTALLTLIPAEIMNNFHAFLCVVFYCVLLPYIWALILGLRSANERRRYFVMTSLIG